MHVEVNEANIDLYQLVTLTGNSREFLLSEAANAAANGHVLSVNVPDDQVIEQNVFDVYESEHVDPRRLNGCGYEIIPDVDGEEHLVCVVHGKTSRRDILADPHAPCIQVDPDERPSSEQLKDAANKTPTMCVYNRRDDPVNGVLYICAVHGRPSKHDISRVPSMPCLSVDPE